MSFFSQPRRTRREAYTIERRMPITRYRTIVIQEARTTAQVSFSWVVRRWQSFDYFDGENKRTDDPSKDRCPRTLGGCRLRFGDRGALPFDGFPGQRDS